MPDQEEVLCLSARRHPRSRGGVLIRGSRSRLNLFIDSIAGLAFLSSALSGRNYYFHIGASILMIAVVVIHLGLHWDWVVRCSRKLPRGSAPGQVRTKINYTVDMFIAVMFAISVISGVVLMTSNAEIIIRTHGLSSWMFVLGVLLHLLLHWRWMVVMSRDAIRAAGQGAGGTERPIASLSQARSEFESGDSIVSAIGEVPQSGRHGGDIA